MMRLSTYYNYVNKVWDEQSTAPSTYIVFYRTPWTLTNGNSLIILVVVTTKRFESFTSLHECLFDLGQVRMILERVGGEPRDFGSAFKFPYVEV